MVLERWNLTRLMVEMLVNRIVLGWWRYINICDAGWFFSLERYHLTEYVPIIATTVVPECSVHKVPSNWPRLIILALALIKFTYLSILFILELSCSYHLTNLPNRTSNGVNHASVLTVGSYGGIWSSDYNDTTFVAIYLKYWWNYTTCIHHNMWLSIYRPNINSVRFVLQW